MLVGGSGDIKLTKDGNTLLREMVLTRSSLDRLVKFGGRKLICGSVDLNADVKLISTAGQGSCQLHCL